MRWLKAAATLGVLLVLCGCTAGHGGHQSATPAPPPLPPEAPKGLAEVTPQQNALLSPAVNRYFHYRKQAVIRQDIGVLHEEYPDLKAATDLAAGINAEADVIGRYSGLEIIGGDVELERYARLQAHVDGQSAVVLVNGLEQYLRKDFTEAGGQVQILLFLTHERTGWTVVRTDETTLTEYHQALHGASQDGERQVPVQVLFNGSGTAWLPQSDKVAYYERRFLVLRSPADMAASGITGTTDPLSSPFPPPGLAQIDFTHELGLFLTRGWSPCRGYGLTIVDATRKDQEVLVRLKLSEQGKICLTAVDFQATLATMPLSSLPPEPFTTRFVTEKGETLETVQVKS